MLIENQNIVYICHYPGQIEILSLHDGKYLYLELLHSPLEKMITLSGLGKVVMFIVDDNEKIMDEQKCTFHH